MRDVRTVVTLMLVAGCWRGTPPATTAPPTAAPTSGGCIPPDTALALVDRGDELLACSTTKCWSIDRTSGSVGDRPFQQPPGIAIPVARDKLGGDSPCYRGLCWTPLEINDENYRTETVFIAYHADGRRVAIADDPLISIYELATKKETARFEHQLGNSLAGLWFANDLVAVRGDDAGPYSVLQIYNVDGTTEDELDGLYEGGVGIGSRGQLVVNESGATRISELELGKDTKRVERAVPEPPEDCYPTDPGMDPEDPAQKACIAFYAKYYAPYSGATIIDDSTGYVGLHGTELFTLDRDLEETSRIKLAACR